MVYPLKGEWSEDLRKNSRPNPLKLLIYLISPLKIEKVSIIN